MSYRGGKIPEKNQLTLFHEGIVHPPAEKSWGCGSHCILRQETQRENSVVPHTFFLLFHPGPQLKSEWVSLSQLQFTIKSLTDRPAVQLWGSLNLNRWTVKTNLWWKGLAGLESRGLWKGMWNITWMVPSTSLGSSLPLYLLLHKLFYQATATETTTKAQPGAKKYWKNKQTRSEVWLTDAFVSEGIKMTCVC